MSSSEESTESSKETTQTPSEIKKILRREKEKNELLRDLASGNFTTMRTRVAGILNLYPDARNSDVTLTLKYWETFQPQIYNRNGILPKDLFRLERFHYIVRARAKIQNEYGLFQADAKIRGHRKDNEEEMRDSVVEDAPPRRLVSIFADETGKNQDFVIVASVWFLTGRAVFDVARALTTWKSASVWAEREVHFAKFGRQDVIPLSEYLQVLKKNREFLSFKVIAVERARTKRNIEEIVLKLHEHMLLKGAEHEVSSGRIDLPRDFELTVDEEQSLDSFTLAEMKTRVTESYERTFRGGLRLSEVQTVSSRTSPLVQIADLVAGALNRHLNFRGERNFKDEMADMIVSELALTLADEAMPELDAAALFRV